MSVSFYFDVHIPLAITNGLRLRGIDVLTAQEDGNERLSDTKLLERAAQINRVFFSFDSDLLKIASEFLNEGKNFAGLVFAHPTEITIGTCVQDLEIIANVLELEETINQIIYLPI